MIDYTVDRFVLRDPTTPFSKKVLKRLRVEVALGVFDFDDENIGYYVQRKTNTYPEMLNIYARSPHGNIRWLITGHPNTSKKTLRYLLKDDQFIISSRAYRRLSGENL